MIAPLLPVPACQTAAGGRPEERTRRVVVAAIQYVIHNRGVWWALPADFPPGARSTACSGGGTPAESRLPCMMRYVRPGGPPGRGADRGSDRLPVRARP